MFHKGKLLVFVGSAMVVLYGISAAFYGKVVAKDEAYKELSVFMDVLKKVNDDYVEAPDMNKVQEGAMRGLVEALDPYSSFLTKDQYASIQKRKSGASAGPGMVVSKRAEVTSVVSCERGGPAESAGVRPGDYLMAIDGTSVEDKSITEVDAMLRGAPGTKVKLSIFRGANTTKPIELEVTRRADAPIPIVAQMLENNVGIIDVSSLANEPTDQIRVKVKTLISAGAKKLILDLRDCADGTPLEGSELANLFLPKGLIYYSQNRQGVKIQEVQAKPEKAVTDLPLVVLINGSTAGPAEIAAGALKDDKRATVVGEKSFGIGSAQKVIQLKSGSVLILSTAKYYTPSGKAIQQDELPRNTGIEPDVKAPDDDKRQDLAVESYYNEQDDAGKWRQFQERVNKIQLDKALEILAKGVVPEKRAA